MCIAAPGKVIKIEGKKALIQYSGNQTRYALIIDEKVKIGSFVSVQMGIIVNVLSKAESLSAAKAWGKIYGK
jgi:hydrogenase expression/formation protein HypC